jgi:peptidoglycan-associated lipoprotein
MACRKDAINPALTIVQALTGVLKFGGKGMGLNHFARHGALAVAVCAGLAGAACSKAPTTDLSANAAAIPGSAADFAQNVGDRVFFESDSSDLTPQGQATLDRQAAWLQRYDNGPFTIEGNADERGTREYNFALGARRAETVKQYLAARGIPNARIRTISYGKEHPVAVCNDISCWSQNRRAETKVGGGQS